MRAKIVYLGGPETGDVGRVTWGEYVLELNKPVEVVDAHVIAKAQTNKFFKVTDITADDPKPPPEPDDDDDDDDDKAPAKAAPGRPPARSR